MLNKNGALGLTVNKLVTVVLVLMFLFAMFYLIYVSQETLFNLGGELF